MASNLTSRARHNSRPCGPVRVCMRESSLVFPTLCIARRGIGTCTRVYIDTHARMRNRSTHAYTHARAHTCVHTHSARDRYALRPSASKPLEVEALRKYNAYRLNLPLSVYTYGWGRIHVHQEREERDAKEMKSRELRKKRHDETTREREREKNGERRRGENNFYGIPSNIHNTYLNVPLLFYTS